jgi:hypothetical protein
MDTSSPPASPSPPTLPDAWASRPIRLDGPLENTSFRSTVVHTATALVGLGVAFLVFQFVVTPVALVSLLGLEALQALASPEDLMDHLRELILSNSAGQILGLAATTFLLTRLHTRRSAAGFLRLRAPDMALLGLAVLGVIALQPVVQWLAGLNQQIPLPEPFRAFDESQRELIKQVVGGDLGLGFSLLMLAVVPGICEELLFRGYAQRQLERGLGVGWGIALSGLLFGLYHLRLSQLLPLAVLGVYLAYLTWRTGSLWPAIVVHFAHNATAVTGAQWALQQGYDVASLDTVSIPWYAVGAGAVVFAGTLYVLHRHAATLHRARSASPETS